MQRVFVFMLISILASISSWAQVDNNGVRKKNTPYELITSYYNEDFKPFKKGTIYMGLSMSLEDRSQENTENIFERVIDGNRFNYNFLIKTGYFINDYAMVGLNASVFENKFTGTLLKDADTVQSYSIKRGFSITPNYRTTIPLSQSDRFSFFTMAGLTFGKSSLLKREIKNLDEIQKSFSDNYNFRIGLSPGATFFVLQNFAIEVQLDVIGYELNIEEKTKNEGIKSRDIRHNIDFRMNLLSVKFGLSYYL